MGSYGPTIVISQKLKQEVINIPKQLILRSLVWESECFHWACIYIVLRDDIGPVAQGFEFLFPRQEPNMHVRVCVCEWESLPDPNPLSCRNT